MILIISLIITLAATIQWIVIRNIPFLIVRIILQVPLLVLTVFLAWFVGAYLTVENPEVEQQRLDAQILDTAVVIRGDIQVSVDATGALTPIQQVPLTFQLPSVPVAEINVEQGQSVAEGDVLATLSADNIEEVVEDAQIALRLQQASYEALTAPVREQDLLVAEAAIESAQAQLNAAVQAGSTLQDREIARLQSEIARNQLWQTQLQRDGIAQPQTTDLIPNVELDDEELEGNVNDVIDLINEATQAQSAAAAAAFQGQLQSANDAVDQVGFGVQIADANFDATLSRAGDAGAVASSRAALVQARNSYERLLNGVDSDQLRIATLNLQLAELAVEQAELNLDQTQLTSPFDGIIAQQNLVEGELPPQGVSMLLIDDSQYVVQLPIDETDIALVQVGQPVLFQVDALPNTEVTGVVDSIAYTPIGGGQLVAYNVRVVVDDTTAPIRAGMTVTGSIIVQQRDDVLLVRNNFIQVDRQTGEAFVTVRISETVTAERQVALGTNNDTFTEILAGLEVGDELILLPRNESQSGS